MYRLLVIILALVATLHFTTITTDILRLRDFIVEHIDSLDIIHHYSLLLLHIRDVVVKSFGTTFIKAMSAAPTLYTDFRDRLIHNDTTTFQPSMNDFQIIQSLLFEASRRAEDAYNAAFVALRTNPFSVYTYIFLFVFLAIHLLPVQHVATAAKRLRDRVAENKNNISAVFEIIQLVAELLILILGMAMWSLAKLTYHLTMHAKYEIGPRFWAEMFAQPCAHCPEPKPKPLRKSFADPAVVERNRRIVQLELEVQEWKQLTDQMIMEHAREEHRLDKQIEELERANRTKAEGLQAVHRFHQAVGLDRGTEAVIRDLRVQLQDAPKQAAKREEELLGEIRELQEYIQRKHEEEMEWRDKDQLYRSYLNEVTKWKNIARQCDLQTTRAKRELAELKSSSAAQTVAEEPQSSSATGNTEHNSPHQEHHQGHYQEHQEHSQEHAGDEVAGDPLPDNEGKPFGMRLTYADGTPVGMPQADTQSDDGWETVSGSSNNGDDGDDDDDAHDTDNAVATPTPAPAPAPSASLGPARSKNPSNPFLGTLPTAGTKSKPKAKPEADDGWETVSEDGKGEAATQGAGDSTTAAPGPSSSSGGPSSSFHNPFLHLKEGEGAAPRTGRGGLAKEPRARRGGAGAGGISRR